MAYFPETIMPAILKKDVPNPVGAILAADFNGHTDQIIAIEKFLGVGPATIQDENLLLASDPATGNVLGILRNLVDAINTFATSGIQTSSGYVQNGGRIIFPDSATVCFLATPPGPTDTTINVTSTLGFPDTGIISILNDSNVLTSATNSGYTPETHVEWILYNGKKSTAFLNCQRGLLGTNVGSHAGSIKEPAQITASTFNILNYNVGLPIGANLVERTYPGMKYRQNKAISPLRLIGTQVEIIRAIRVGAEMLDLSQQALGNAFNAIIGAADGLGILALTLDGRSILKSEDPMYVALHQLSWSEASAFYDLLNQQNLVLPAADPNTTSVGTSVPVFQGKMSIQYSMAASTLNPLIVNAATGERQIFQKFIAALRLTQSANGIIQYSIDTDSLSDTTISTNLFGQSIIQYRTFFVASSRSLQDRSAGNV